MWDFFYYFHFARNYDILKSKNVCFLFNENTKFNKNKIGSKMGNPTHGFRGMNIILLQFIQGLQIKSKTVMSLSSRNKQEWIFCNVYFVRKKSFIMCFISMYSVLNKLQEYIYFYISKNTTLLLLVFKITKTLKSILNDISCLVWCKNVVDIFSPITDTAASRDAILFILVMKKKYMWAVTFHNFYVQILHIEQFCKTKTDYDFNLFFFFFKLEFTPCKAEQSLQGMELQEKEAHKY